MVYLFSLKKIKPYIKWAGSKPLLKFHAAIIRFFLRIRTQSRYDTGDDCCLHETLSYNKDFELTHFYVWFRPALSYLRDIEHFCSNWVRKIDRLKKISSNPWPMIIMMTTVHCTFTLLKWNLSILKAFKWFTQPKLRFFTSQFSISSSLKKIKIVNELFLSVRCFPYQGISFVDISSQAVGAFRNHVRIGDTSPVKHVVGVTVESAKKLLRYLGQSLFPTGQSTS